MNKVTFSDIFLTCCDCKETFLFSTGEQAFYRSKTLSIPHRCLSCRRKRKASLVPDDNQICNCNNRQEGSINDNNKHQ